MRAEISGRMAVAAENEPCRRKAERKITYRVVLQLMQCNRKFDESAKIGYGTGWNGMPYGSPTG